MLLCLVVPASALAVGTVHVPLLFVVSVALGVAAVLALLGRALGSGLPSAAWVLVAATIVSLLQTLPLRQGWVAFLAPATAEVWNGALSAFREPSPRWIPLSLAPSATAIEALKGFTYLCAFLAAACAGARKGARWGALVLGGSALLLALATLGHGLVGAETLFGLYAPQTGARGWKLAPLINPNNLAGYLNFGALSAAGLLALPRPPLPRWLLGLGIALITAVSVLTGSRGGALSLTCGAALLVLLLRVSAKRNAVEYEVKPAWREFAVTAVGAMLLGVVCAFLAFGARTWELLRDDNFSKVGVALRALGLSHEHALFGIGRGAFESVFPAIKAGGDNVIYAHPENFIVQWLVEWGIPFGSLLLLAGAWHLRPSYWGATKNPAASGIYAAFAALTLQNLFDMSFEVPGVAIAAAAGAGVCIGARSAETKRLVSDRTRSSVLVLGLLGALTLALAAVKGRPTLNDAKLAAQKATESVTPDSWPALRQQLHGSMQRFPAEPYFPRLGAFAAWKAHAESPLPWIDRALERGMSAGRTHYLLGGYLASRKLKSQALLELRLAATHDPQLTANIATVALGLTKEPAELRQMAPAGVAGVSTLVALARAIDDPAGARILLTDAVGRAPNAPGPRRLLLDLLLDDLERRSPDCSESARASCAAQAQAHLDALAKAPNPPVELPQLRARLLLATDRASEALTLLREECPRAPNRLRCYRTLADAAGAARDVSSLTELGKMLQREPCTENSAECSNALWRVGTVAKTIGALDLTLSLYEHAADEEASAAKWLQVAQTAEAAGQNARALKALNRAVLLSPNDSKNRAQVDRLRLKLLISAPAP